jgi:hypothetical protein
MNETIFREVWAESSEDEYFEMLCALPPEYDYRVLLEDGEQMNAFLLGEPSDHEAGFPTYHAFLYFRERYYRSRRPMAGERFLFEMGELRR